MTVRLFAVFAALAFAALPGAGAELNLPDGARVLSDRVVPLGSYALPVGAFDGDRVPVRVLEGRIQRRTWRIDGTAASSLQLLAPLREQITGEGYEPVFECAGQGCGGFDFRFRTEVAPAPSMYVDLRDYRFFAAVREGGDAIGLLVSRSRSAAYIQTIRVMAGAPGAERAGSAGPDASPVATGPGLGDALIAAGRVVLRDLEFTTGADALGPGPYASLEQLAAFLTDNPGYVIALVGHTDSVGALERNIALSKRRAEAVRARIHERFGIAPERIEAEGMGYLAPIASNLTAAGREANRRVEAILLRDAQ